MSVHSRNPSGRLRLPETRARPPSRAVFLVFLRPCRHHVCRLSILVVLQFRSRVDFVGIIPSRGRSSSPHQPFPGTPQTSSFLSLSSLFLQPHSEGEREEGIAPPQPLFWLVSQFVLDPTPSKDLCVSFLCASASHISDVSGSCVYTCIPTYTCVLLPVYMCMRLYVYIYFRLCLCTGRSCMFTYEEQLLPLVTSSRKKVLLTVAIAICSYVSIYVYVCLHAPVYVHVYIHARS